MTQITEIREFDSRPTLYKLEGGKIFERVWNRWEGGYGLWTDYGIPANEVNKYWKALVKCVTRDVTDPEYDEAAFEVTEDEFTERQLVVIYGQFMKDWEVFSSDKNEYAFTLETIKKIREQLGEEHYTVKAWDEFYE